MTPKCIFPQPVKPAPTLKTIDNMRKQIIGRKTPGPKPH